MAYTAVPTVNTGDPWSASDHNTYVKDNFAYLKTELDNINSHWTINTVESVRKQLGATFTPVVFGYITPHVAGDGKGYISIPAYMDGWKLHTPHARVITAGTTGTLDIQIYNVTKSVDMLTTVLSVDSGETGSDTAATAAVVNASNATVAAYDLLRVDIDAVQTTAGKGLILQVPFGD